MYANREAAHHQCQQVGSGGMNGMGGNRRGWEGGRRGGNPGSIGTHQKPLPVPSPFLFLNLHDADLKTPNGACPRKREPKFPYHGETSTTAPHHKIQHVFHWHGCMGRKI